MAETATAERTEKKKEKLTIHKREGYGPMDIYAIEKAFHPRSKEILDEELTALVDKIFDEHVKAGTVKDADAAADAFIDAFAHYHFGKDHEDLDVEHVKKILREEYGINRTALKKAFQRRGAYKKREDFYAQHKTPAVERADETRKQNAQQTLEEYRNDKDTKEELVKHMETRTGKETSSEFKSVVPLEKLVRMIGNYMALPAAQERIKRNRKARLGLSDAQAGHPDLYDAFEEGDRYHAAYIAEAQEAKAQKLKPDKEKEEK